MLFYAGRFCKEADHWNGYVIWRHGPNIRRNCTQGHKAAGKHFHLLIVPVQPGGNFFPMMHLEIVQKQENLLLGTSDQLPQKLYQALLVCTLLISQMHFHTILRSALSNAGGTVPCTTCTWYGIKTYCFFSSCLHYSKSMINLLPTLP